MRRLGVRTKVCLVLAGLWGLAQLVLAFFVHVAVRGHETSSGWFVPPSKTSMQAYGASEVVLTAVALGLAFTVGIALARRVARDLSGAGRAAWIISLVTAALGAVGFHYLLGVGVCLLLACVSMPRLPASSSSPSPRRSRPVGASSR